MLVKETVSLPVFVIVMPSLVKVALLPAASLTVTPLASALVSSPAAFFNVLLVAMDTLVLPAPSLITFLSAVDVFVLAPSVIVVPAAVVAVDLLPSTTVLPAALDVFVLPPSV